MAGKTLVIVESPTKAKTIVKFLGNDYIVKASNGHIRDLPNSAKEIPAKIKKEKWSTLGVDIANDFQALYVVPSNKKDHVKSLQDALKDASALYLATDEDREGESISWHLVEVLKPKVPVKRLVFHEITKQAIQEALNSTRDIDENLVRAQETRRIVDRLFGYEVSPILWKKMLPRLSAGRVQSVAVRLLVERERERIKFKKSTYWGISGKFSKLQEKTPIQAELTHADDKRVATGKDFDADTGKLIDPGGIVLLSEAGATSLQEKIQRSTPIVSSVEEKPFTTKPAAPFVTSTLQQEGNRKLRFSAKRTMILAQELYENGFITYMRTDSTVLSDEALRGARAVIEKEYGKEYLSKENRVYLTKVKNAQEAHEAIRPAGENFTPPEKVKEALHDDAFRLYDLIWKRTVASQMLDARGTYTTVEITAGPGRFRTTGKTIEFPGFLRAYVESTDDPEAELSEQERILPKLQVGEKLNIEELLPEEHQTKPPPRFTEGSLIKELERLGIGRPSTWATVVELVLSRDYAFKKSNALVPTYVAMGVVGLLEKYFTQFLDYTFTARLEDDLDAISRGEAENTRYLKTFYFGNGVQGLKGLVENGEKTIDPREVCGMPLGKSQDGKDVEIRIGRYGPFLSNGTTRTSVPDMLTPEELTLEKAEELLRTAEKEVEALGTHPESGEKIFVKSGRFGPYLQMGVMVEDGPKPKMASLLPSMKPEAVTLDIAIRLLSLPRSLGSHPETKDEVFAANGRYGPYIKCGSETRSIPDDVSTPIDITLDQALELLKQPKGRGRASTPKTLRDLGAHPVSGLPLVIRSGRYGPYVTDGELNASLQRGSDPNSLTLEEAVGLLEARASYIAAGGGKKKSRSKKKAPTKKEAKKETKKEAGTVPKKKKSTKASSETASNTPSV